MTITALPTAPNTNAPTVFASRMDTFLAALSTFVTEANAQAAAMNALSAGTAVGIPYTFSTTTTDADPGAGYLRLDNATQNTATTIRADLLGSDGSTWTDVLATFDDSDSTVKGHILLQKLADATKWILFTVSSLASPSGYKNITVTVVSASAANPFTNGDALVLKFTRTGDKGAAGSVTTASQAQMEAATDNTVSVTPLSTNWHPGVAKVWLNAVGDGSAINTSWNVTSITDTGTGILTVTIATDFSGTQYVVLICGEHNGDSLRGSTYSQAAGSFQARVRDASAAVDPATSWLIACFGDQ